MLGKFRLQRCCTCTSRYHEHIGANLKLQDKYEESIINSPTSFLFQSKRRGIDVGHDGVALTAYELTFDFVESREPSRRRRRRLSETVESEFELTRHAGAGAGVPVGRPHVGECLATGAHDLGNGDAEVALEAAPSSFATPAIGVVASAKRGGACLEASVAIGATELEEDGDVPDCRQHSARNLPSQTATSHIST